MAAVDSFELLFREMSKVFSHVRDTFALIGVCYVAGKSLLVLSSAANAAYVHVYSGMAEETDLRQKFGAWAVVTGGSDGIGKAYAMELARRGMNIVLLSKEEKKLIKAAQEIEEEYSVQVEYISVDFSLEVKEGLYDTIWTGLAGKEIGILVNNVGVMYDYPQMFLDVPEKKLWQLIHVNVAAATLMTHMILPQMVKRHRGAVVNMSSGACVHVTPQVTVYAATKAYLDYFSRALEFEYKEEGIVVQCLVPFYVSTRMTRYSETLSKTSLFIPSAATFAHSAVRTLGFSSHTTGYLPHTVLRWLSMLCPEWLWKRMAARLNVALRHQAKVRQQRHRVAIPSSSSAFSLSEGQD
ncbi:inactive hydroxysteroid dehydrogenase-like protein 1 [Babylonia areolata]|uniref:inactive hydroxysteroid dehydrogenase-like protein 1 n=1 Tax=Babylonia areolata TaxID=304850 RepID=UPI003FD5BBEB